MSENQPYDADEVLVARAQERFQKNRECQLLAALIAQLRDRNLVWWSPAEMNQVWPTHTRFQWFESRPDVRGRLTQKLTGLPPLAARESERPFQAELIERVVEAGDVTYDDWERAFAPEELAVHAPASVLWQEFRDRFPWDDPEPADKDLMVWLLGELLDERKSGSSIMTPLYVRSAIDVRVWQEHVPLEVRVQVDGRRLRKELEGKTFTCRDELAVVKLERVVEHIPTVQLRGILDALERVLPALAGQAEIPTGDDEPDNTDSVPKGPAEAY
ncbi:MAG: hypothetical protein ABMB14_29260 [Myxococcota bacterium]